MYQQLELPLCNVQAPALSPASVVQQTRSGSSILDIAQQFTFYATFDVDSLCSYIPAGTPVLLPASSWARVGLKKPSIPPQITDTGADCGGFVASRIWGEYRYDLTMYEARLRTWSPQWAATMDYCCEPELCEVTRERQAKTTANAREAWLKFKSASWAWVPTIQGWTPDDYRRHAHELLGLIEEMRIYYADNSAWRVGIGTLCRRADVVTVQAIIDAVCEVLPPDITIHLWGIKLDALRSLNLHGRGYSSDSAVHHMAMYAKNDIKAAAANAGMSLRRYKVMVNLPAYITKVYEAVDEARKVASAQSDRVLLARARAVLKAEGWTINIRIRRNRQYVYAARRNGSHIEQRSICPVAGLEAWLSRHGLLHNPG